MTDTPTFLNCIHDLTDLVGQIAQDADALSVVGAELATALVGNEAMTQVVMSALVCALSDPAVSPASSGRTLQRMADSVQTTRAMLSAAGTA